MGCNLLRPPKIPGETLADCRTSTGEGETPYRFAFEGVVRVEVLARRVKIRVSHEVLDRDDVTALLEEACCVRMAEFVQGSMLDSSALRDCLKSSQQVGLSAASRAGKYPFGFAGESFQEHHEIWWNGDHALLVVFGREAFLALAGDANCFLL